MKIEPNQMPLAIEPNAQEKEAMQKVSKQFESLLINQMVGEMRKTVGKSDFIPKSHAEKVYESMLDYEYAQKLSETEQMGLSKMIYDHLLQRYKGG